MDDLYVFGLTARDASLLRDYLVRAEVRVDTDVEEDAVRVPAWENRGVRLDALLGLLERWALEEGFAALPIHYGERSWQRIRAVDMACKMILVAYDGSEAAVRALDRGADLPRNPPQP